LADDRPLRATVAAGERFPDDRHLGSVALIGRRVVVIALVDGTPSGPAPTGRWRSEIETMRMLRAIGRFFLRLDPYRCRVCLRPLRCTGPADFTPGEVRDRMMAGTLPDVVRRGYRCDGCGLTRAMT
jgi:hypothetical protein